jgi:hypothetical protein
MIATAAHLTPALDLLKQNTTHAHHQRPAAAIMPAVVVA